MLYTSLARQIAALDLLTFTKFTSNARLTSDIETADPAPKFGTTTGFIKGHQVTEDLNEEGISARTENGSKVWKVDHVSVQKSSRHF